ADPAGFAHRIAVIAAVAHERPAEVSAGHDPVELIASLRPVFAGPQLVRAGAQRRTLHVAVSEAPDLRALDAEAGIVHRDRAVAVEADDLADRRAQALRECR